MTIKHFKIPSFEEAKHNITTCDVVGNYEVYIFVYSYIEIELSAIADYDSEIIFEKSLRDTENISEDKAHAWYDKTIKELNEFWEQYIAQTYFLSEDANQNNIN